MPALAMEYGAFKKEIRSIIGVDLDSYKEQQMQRRIRQWVARHRLETLNGLVDTLRQDPLHKRQFLDYLTINTSHFFRDKNVFQYLSERLLPEICARRRAKIWSAGCSIGAEAYSLVMILLEAGLNFQPILATDLDEGVLAKAREGLYQESQLAALPQGYRRKYFTPVGGSLKIASEVQKQVRFSRHNLLEDRFSNGFDLIMCRNVFIYFTTDVQRVLITNFVRSLNPGGFFVVGSAEQIMNPAVFGIRRVTYCVYQKD